MCDGNDCGGVGTRVGARCAKGALRLCLKLRQGAQGKKTPRSGTFLLDEAGLLMEAARVSKRLPHPRRKAPPGIVLGRIECCPASPQPNTINKPLLPVGSRFT